MTNAELIAVLRHYAALYPTQVCPPGVLLAAAGALAALPPRRTRKAKSAAAAQDVAFAPEVQHDIE